MKGEEIEVICFMIEGENIIVPNPCTIPIKMLQEQLKKKRKKGEVTIVGGFMLKIPKELLK